MKSTVVALAGFLLLTVGAADGQQKKESVTRPEDACCCSTYDTGQCLIAVDKKVETELEETYKKALEQTSEPEIKKGLEKAETAWVAYRDANCDAEYATYGRGTMGPNMAGFCNIRLARQRIQELKDIYLPEH